MADKSVFLMSQFPDFSAEGFDMEKYNRQFWERNSVIAATSNNVSYDKHWGPLSAKFVLSGEEYYQTDHSRYLVNPSNFLILNNNTEYSSFIDSDKEVRSFTLNFSEKYVSETLAGMMCKPEKLLDEASLAIATNVRFVERTYHREQRFFSLISKIRELTTAFEERNDEVSELFNEFLYTLLLLNKKVEGEINDVKALKLSTREELYKRLHYARDYIECCFDQDINITSVALVACLNREYLIRQFKLYFGITPTQYLIKRRMEAAKYLLQTSDNTISEVCKQVGYADLTSFCKLFRRHYHVNPEGFRSMHFR